MHPMLDFLKAVEKAGYSFHTIYDIGACKGEWSREFKNYFPASKIILFEANPAYKDELDALGLHHFNCVLSNPGRKYVDFYNGTNTGDSYYKETTKVYDTQNTIRLPCFTLEDIVTENALPLPNFIKIDTQGSELDILSGFQKHLHQVDFIYAELPIVTYNAGAPNFQDYLDFFKENKFIPVDILEIHRGENIVVQLDIMFVRDTVKTRYFGPHNWIRPFAK